MGRRPKMFLGPTGVISVPAPCVLFLSLLILYAHHLPIPRSDGLAEVKGMVTDFAGARVAGATLRFADGQHGYAVKTSPDGTYSIHIAPGPYTINATSPGFCPTRRGAFLVGRDSVVKFDFELMLCAYDSFRMPYEEEELAAPDASSPKPLAQFGCRKEHGAIEYTGLIQQGTYIRPVVSYNVWTLRANLITYDRRAQMLTGEGNVMWQDGETTKVGQFIQIHLLNPPEVKMIKGAS